MVDYLDRIGAGYVIHDPEPLDFDYVPQQIVCREQYQSQLAARFASIDRPESSCRAVITGPVGSGKTVLVKTFCRDLQRHLVNRRTINIAHVNCRNASTSTRVVQRILHAIDPGHPDRGLSIGELLLSLRKLTRRNSSHLIVILDEVDHMLRKSGDDILYQLLRIDEDQEGKGTLSLILISQEQVLDVLETAVISRMGKTNLIKIPSYGEDELFKIASQRAELALVNGSYTEEIIRLIAQKSAPIGDARLAIELLKAAAESCEIRQDDHTERAISIDDVHAKDEILSVDMVSEIDAVEGLKPHAMFVLLAICRRLKKDTTMTTGDVENLYAVVCEEYEESMKSHTTLWKYLKEMENRQLITTRISTVNDGRGRTTHLSMPHFLPSDIASRLEMLIKKRL
ncbi:MAG TPA: AAA family ATPase [Candidatus Poseidoniaceae archaeon]|nr:MAG TPA: AAA family ATPase [Candidatus Poseidoniales archaeon]HII45350.1 AAA family ATPase [Candidatus Poseidoniaceae archaeon]